MWKRPKIASKLRSRFSSRRSPSPSEQESRPELLPTASQQQSFGEESYSAVSSQPPIEEAKEATFISKNIEELGKRFRRKKQKAVTEIISAPKLERFMINPTKEEFKDIIRDTKVGTLVGVPAVLAMWPVMVPLYAIFRGLSGQTRDEAVTNSFQLSLKVFTIIAAAAGIYSIVGIPIVIALAPVIISLWKPIDKWTDMDLKQFKIFAKQVQDDPELQAKAFDVASQFTVKAAQVASSQAISDKNNLAALNDTIKSVPGQPPSPAAIKLANKIDNPTLKAAILSGKLNSEAFMDLQKAISNPEVYNTLRQIDPDLSKNMASREEIRPEYIKDLAIDTSKTIANVTTKQAMKEGLIDESDISAVKQTTDMLANRAMLMDDLSGVQPSLTTSYPSRVMRSTSNQKSQKLQKSPVSKDTIIKFKLADEMDKVIYQQQAQKDMQDAAKLVTVMKQQGIPSGQAIGKQIAALQIRERAKQDQTYGQFLNWLETQKQATQKEYKKYVLASADVVDPIDFQNESERLQSEINTYESYALKLRSMVV